MLLLKAGNDLLEGREGAAGSEEIQVTILFLASLGGYKTIFHDKLLSGNND